MVERLVDGAGTDKQVQRFDLRVGLARFGTAICHARVVPMDPGLSCGALSQSFIGLEERTAEATTLAKPRFPFGSDNINILAQGLRAREVRILF